MMRPLTNGPRPTTKDSLSRLDTEVIVCTRCPRLVEYRAEVARVKRRAYREWEYWGKPVPGFGDPKARVLVLGLAPGAHGSNRTGRPLPGTRPATSCIPSCMRRALPTSPV